MRRGGASLMAHRADRWLALWGPAWLRIESCHSFKGLLPSFRVTEMYTVFSIRSDVSTWLRPRLHPGPGCFVRAPPFL